MALAGPSLAALTSGEADVFDTRGSRRSFTNSETERVGFSYRVTNSQASESRIDFSFWVLDPSGRTVFSHTGNASEGAVGVASSKVSGVRVAALFTGPGTYRLKTKAALGSESVEAEVPFEITSPLVTLVYPISGMRELAPPFTFQWSGSGSQYRLLVDDDAGFGQPILVRDASRTLFPYPPARLEGIETLSAGHTYYWKVESLDAAGSRLAVSDTWSFSLKDQAAGTSNDFGISSLELAPGPQKSDEIAFKLKVKNFGTTSRPVRATLHFGGGQAVGSPHLFPPLEPGKEEEVVLTAAFPASMEAPVALAALLDSDDFPQNNTAKLQVRRAEAPAAAGGPVTFLSDPRLQADAVWSVLVKGVGPQTQQQLRNYRLVGIKAPEGTTADQLAEWINDLRTGKRSAKVRRTRLRR